jgi:S-adenosyl-L-methionine hydrolase (adenosine-forming)
MPLVTLTTDFGAGSPYVAAMKGKLLAGCPEASLVDVSHSIGAFDVRAAAFVVWAGTRDFPPGSVHLVVVDPGVGGERRPIALRVQGSWYVGPDNGLFGMVLEDAGGHAAAVIELWRSDGAAPTFEGRDVFAPAAAVLAAGGPATSVGAPTDREPVRLPPRPPSVLWVDNFGNLVTNLKPPVGGLRVGGREIREVGRTYSDARPGEPFCYLGSMGFLEVGVREASAADLLRVGVGALVERL